MNNNQYIENSKLSSTENIYNIFLNCADCDPCKSCMHEQESIFCDKCDPCSQTKICACCGDGFCKCDPVVETENGLMHQGCQSSAMKCLSKKNKNTSSDLTN